MKPTYKHISLTIVAVASSLALNAFAFGPRDLLITAKNNPGHSAPVHGIPLVQLPADTLFYNGDFDGINGLSNEQDTSLGSGEYGRVYDDFVVDDSGGWDVTAVFSHDLMNTNVTGATYEIRTGVSENNGGTVVASGQTNSPIVTLIGSGGFGYLEYEVEIDGLSVHLNPGSYHLNVTPIGDLTGRSFDSTTSGANSIGDRGLPSNAFFDSNYFGFNFEDTDNVGVAGDFSLGVIGTSGSGGGITLTAQIHRSHGNRVVALNWTPANGGQVNVLKNNTVVLTTDDDGGTQDRLGSQTGTFFYQVCETDTGTCSNTVRVVVRH